MPGKRRILSKTPPDQIIVHGRILQSKIILYGTKIVPPKDTCPAEVHIEVG